MASTKAQQLEQFIDRQGLRHFKGKEFTPFWSKSAKGVKNSIPNESLWTNIVPTLIVLDELRERLGTSIRMTSTYRTPAYNHAIGGEPLSMHQEFRAIDFTCSSGTPRDWESTLLSLRGTRFTLPGNGGQFVFRGGIGRYDTKNFVHADTRGKDERWTG